MSGLEGRAANIIGKERETDTYRDARIILFAIDLHKKYPHIKGVYKDKAYDQAKERRPPYMRHMILPDLMAANIISPNTVNVLDDILNRLDRNEYERPTLLAKVGKAINHHRRNKHRATYSDSVMIRNDRKYEAALQQQRSMRESGNAPPLSEILEEEYGERKENLESAIMVTLDRYFKQHPDALEEARDKLEPVLCLPKIRRKFKKDKNRKKKLLKGLGATLLIGAAIYINMPESKAPKKNYGNMQKFYQSIFVGIKTRDKEDIELERVHQQIESTYDCINETLSSGTEQQKKEAQELKLKLDRVKANLDIAKRVPQDEMMLLQASEIEKMLGGK